MNTQTAAERPFQSKRLETSENLETPCLVEVSVVMPCLNEAETLETCIKKAQQAFRDLAIVGEVVIADNGSTDGSREIAFRMGTRLVDVKQKGYGAALAGGMVTARGKFIIMGDADDSYDFSNLAPFIEKLRAGYDLVMGNRFKGGIKSGAMPLLHKYLGNPVLTALGRLFFGSPCSDFHCGLRGFSKASFMGLNLRTTGMEFASEMVVKASLHHLRITEVPTVLSPDGRTRPPHLRTWRDGWRHLRFLLLYSPRWLFFNPGIVLMLIGAAVGLWLLTGPKEVGRVTFDIHTLLYCAAAVYLGFQAVLFAAFTKIFAVSQGLFPADSHLDKLVQSFTLEKGLLLGSAMTVIGAAGSLYALTDWSVRSFGPLDPAQTLRIVIPSVLSLTLGCQTIFSSFFLSMLGMARR
jgi:glycosyltransferase involved in cell wall biosynthesis